MCRLSVAHIAKPGFGNTRRVHPLSAHLQKLFVLQRLVCVKQVQPLFANVQIWRLQTLQFFLNAHLVCKFARLVLPCVADLVGCKLSSAHSQFCACECPILVLQVCKDGLQQVQDLLCNFARLVRTFINLGSIFAPCVLHELANLVLQVAH